MCCADLFFIYLFVCVVWFALGGAIVGCWFCLFFVISDLGLYCVFCCCDVLGVVGVVVLMVRFVFRCFALRLPFFCVLLCCVAFCIVLLVVSLFWVLMLLRSFSSFWVVRFVLVCVGCVVCWHVFVLFVVWGCCLLGLFHVCGVLRVIVVPVVWLVFVECLCFVCVLCWLVLFCLVSWFGVFFFDVLLLLVVVVYVALFCFVVGVCL